MKKLFYTLFLAIFALNLCAEGQYTAYFAFKENAEEIILPDDCEYITTSAKNYPYVYIVKHNGSGDFLFMASGIAEGNFSATDDLTYIEGDLTKGSMYEFSVYSNEDIISNIVPRNIGDNKPYFEAFKPIGNDFFTYAYKSKYNFSIFGSVYVSYNGNSAKKINPNSIFVCENGIIQELTEIVYSNNDPSTSNVLNSSYTAKITHNVNNYDIEKFQWVSCPYNAELSITVGSNNTNAVYTFAGDKSYDGTKPAFMLMKYDGTQQNPWVDNMSTTLDAGVGYLLAIDDKGQGNVNASYISTAQINKIQTSTTRTYQEYTNANLAEDNNLYLIGSGLFHENIGCKFTNQRFQYFAVPRDDENGYDEHRATGLTSINFIKPHTAVFMQYSGDITFDNSGNVSQNAPSLKRAMEQQIVVEEYNITLAGSDFEEKTTILTDELGTEGYTIGEDFLYFHSSPNGDVENQFYSFDANRTLSFNHRANSTQTIQLGGLIAQDGRFTISLEGINTKATSVILTDNVENTFVDLINENYTFDANSGSLDGRFTVTINYAPNTTVDTDVITNSNGIVVINNIEGCTIENLIAGEQVMIFDAMGRLVYNAQADADFVNVTLNAGTYIVRQNNNWAKFVIK